MFVERTTCRHLGVSVLWAVATADTPVAVSVGPICRFCRKPLGRPPYSQAPV